MWSKDFVVLTCHFDLYLRPEVFPVEGINCPLIPLTARCRVQTAEHREVLLITVLVTQSVLYYKI